MTLMNIASCPSFQISRLHSDVDRLFGGLFESPFAPCFPKAGDFGPRMDLRSDEKGYVLSVELPGIEPDAVKLELEGRVLSVSGEKREERGEQAHIKERFYGSFLRRVVLPEDADAEAISASSSNGVLSVVMPRREGAKAKAIEVKRA